VTSLFFNYHNDARSNKHKKHNEYWENDENCKVKVKVKVKVKFTLEQAMKARRGSRGIALFLP